MKIKDNEVNTSQADLPVNKTTFNINYKLFLWVLGWIIIFPVPLTILMLRNKKLNNKVKYGIIAAAWIIFLIYVFFGLSDNSDNRNNTSVNNNVVTPITQAVDTHETDQPKTSETYQANGNNTTITTEEVVEEINNLDLFFLALSPETPREEIVDLAKEYNLFSKNRNTGTGIYVYRFANTKQIADFYNDEKGSLITVSYDALNDNELKEITYFNEEKMVGGFWVYSKGYYMIDYNNPQYVSDLNSSEMLVESFDEIVAYTPEIPHEDNLLEELLLSVTATTTKSDLIDYVNEHNLDYNPRGKGNHDIIAYTYDVTAKYGNEGSYITFDYDKSGIVTNMTYYEYPCYYRYGYKATYYHELYPYSDLVGYYLEVYNEDPVEYADARSLIDEINAHRQ